MKRQECLRNSALAGIGAATATTGMTAFEPLKALASSASAAKSLSGLRTIVIVKTTNSGYWQVVLAGAKKAVADFGIQGLKFTGSPIGEADVAGDVALLENAIVQKPDFIVLAPTSATGLTATIEKAYNAGIPLIQIDSASTTTKYSAFLQTNNVGGGVLIADALAAAIKTKTGSASGQVAYSTFLSNVGSLGQRDSGFLK